MISPCQDSIPGCIEGDFICNLVSVCPDMSDESSCNSSKRLIEYITLDIVLRNLLTGSELFPFGSVLGDTVTRDIDNDVIGPIDLTSPIGYFGQPETRLYVCTECVLECSLASYPGSQSIGKRRAW